MKDIPDWIILTLIVSTFAVFSCLGYELYQELHPKLKFHTGECVVLEGKDPWETVTCKILEVGKHSYRVETRYTANDSLPFNEQSKYELTTCPKELK